MTNVIKFPGRRALARANPHDPRKLAQAISAVCYCTNEDDCTQCLIVKAIKRALRAQGRDLARVWSSSWRKARR